jgi:hypothetical protein
VSRVWSAAGIELSFHRIGRAGWSHEGVLRSWAEAPWQPLDDGVAVACLAVDAVWLGLTNTALEAATVIFTAAPGPGSRRLQVPPDWQLGWLPGPDAQPVPLELAGAPTYAYRIDVHRKGDTPDASFGLLLMSPAAWALQFKPIELPPAEPPPPMRGYSRMVRPRGLSSMPRDA